MEIIQMYVPNAYLCALLNSDESGMNDDDIEALNKLEQEWVAEGLRFSGIDYNEKGEPDTYFTRFRGIGHDVTLCNFIKE